jgi:bifunctional non-homologous end joining protein LigD
MRGDGKRENWLLIKENDDEARKDSANGDFLEDLSVSVKSRRSMEEIAGGEAPAQEKKPAGKTADQLSRLMERYPDVQLATLVDRPPEGDQWIHEIKFDGYRLLGFVSGGSSCLRTRNGKDWTESFLSLAVALENLKAKDAVLDMEAVIVDAQGKSSFQALQAALGGGGSPNKIIAYAFDLLYLDGKDLTTRPLTERKERLEVLLKQSKQNSALHYSEHIVGQGAKMFAKACEMGLEGIVSKQAGAPYTAGRQKGWLKTKCAQRQEFIILGFSAARSGERALGALYLGYRKDGALRYAGKVGTGFSMKSAHDLVKHFDKLADTKPVLTRAETAGLTGPEWQSIRWIKPVLLCEVAFTEWTQDGRIRHPSFQGLREDKDADDVKKETPVPTAAASGTIPAKKKAGGLVACGITITHPDRVISETGHITKGELAEYYAGVAPFLLPRIGRHPVSLLRCPSGIDGECFYQRNPGKGLGPYVHSYKFRHNGKTYEYLYIEDEKGLLEVIQMGAIEIHPWGASIDAIDYPDRMIFDLDPAPDVPFEALKLAAEDLRKRLDRKGLESTLKCTGGKGLHVTAPLAGKDKWPVVKSFAAHVAQEMVAAAPDAYIATMSKAKRTGKIFIDYFRNDYTATAIADYAVRARPGAPVAMPLEWKELKTVKSASQFTMKDVLKRLQGKKPDTASRQRGQTIPSE